MRILAAALLILCLAGCSKSKERDGYLIVSSEKATLKQGEIEGEVLIFTLKHRGVVIKAHCQIMDVTNHCGELRVGEIYSFERIDALRFLSRSYDGHGPSAVLGIEDEHLQ
jgi:hypothetical protein